MSVIFIFSGEARTSPFNLDITKRCNDILNSYNEYLFNEQFKATYNYKIYITADNIHLEDTINYFTPDKIGNIHLLDTDFYLKPITNKIPDSDFFLKKYNDKDFKYCWTYYNGIYQHHKILDCYNLFRNDDVKPLYIIRIRLDVIIQTNICDMLNLFETNPNLNIICHWDFMSIGKPDIMNCCCTGLENNYGNYVYLTPVAENPPIMNDYHTIERNRWTYAPERQLFEMLFEYCNNNNLDIHDSIKSNDMCSIVRYNGYEFTLITKCET
jgi:hypothetical protein